MTNDQRIHGFWRCSAPPAPATGILDEEIAMDIAVVCGGFTGCSAALHLAEGAAAVPLLEAAGIGLGASGRNVGLVNAGLWMMPDDLPQALGAVHGQRLLSLLGEAPSMDFDLVERLWIECEVERRETLHCAVGAGGRVEIEEQARQWRSPGAAACVLLAAETAVKVGSRAYSGALLDERAGTIQPLADCARPDTGRAHGGCARVHRKRCDGGDGRGNGWRLVAAQGAARARSVVVATDAYTSGVYPQLRRERVHLPYFNIATRPLDDDLRRTILRGREGARDTHEILNSFRLDEAGRLALGSVGVLRGTGGPVHRSWGCRALGQLFPQLGPVSFEYKEYGMIGMTDNALPVFHRLARDVVAFGGYNGRGIARGTVFGRALADLLLRRIGEDELPLPATDPCDAPRRRVREPSTRLAGKSPI